MLKKFYRRDIYEILSYNFKCYFEYCNSVVQTQNISKQKVRMEIITECELPEFYSATETARFCRKNLLIIQGIVTFFTGVAITVNECSQMDVGRKAYEHEEKAICLKVNEVDYTDDLKKLLKKLEKNPSMVISLLDRWRKALYLESIDGETDLFHDEIALNLFQIVELLANSLGKEFKKGLLKKTENLLENYYRDCYNTEMQGKEIVRNVKKSVESILLENSYTLAKKLKYFLECHNLLDQDVSDFVDDVINIRNSVAHGREINQKNFMWPLPAFFNLIKDSYEVVAILKALAAEMMGQYIGTNRWSGEWQTIRQLLPLSKITMEKFFNNNISGEIINRVSLIEGNKYNITWDSLFDFYVKNPKSKILEKIEKDLKMEFLDTVWDEENADSLFNISIILADSSDEDIKLKAVANVKEIISKGLYGWANFKDVLGYLEFHSVQVKWYKEFLENMSTH